MVSVINSGHSSIVNKDFGVKKTGLLSWLHHLLSLGPWASGLSLCTSDSLLYKLEIKIMSILQDHFVGF